jgi:hypothetical protein
MTGVYANVLPGSKRIFMKMFMLVNIVLFVLAMPVFAQNNSGVGITNLLWKTGDAVISEACVKDNVRITFNTVNISKNSSLTICIFEKNDNGIDDFVSEIICPAEGNNTVSWIVEFDENADNASTKEIEENGFTVPEYYFIIKYGEYTSGKSNIIKIYGYIDIELVDENTQKALSNRPYRIYFANKTKHEGISDKNGRIIVRNAIIGERYIMVGNEEKKTP